MPAWQHLRSRTRDLKDRAHSILVSGVGQDTLPCSSRFTPAMRAFSCAWQKPQRAPSSPDGVRHGMARGGDGEHARTVPASSGSGNLEDLASACSHLKVHSNQHDNE